MRIEAEYTLTMVQDDNISIDPEILGKRHLAAVGGRNLGISDRRQINPEMDLMIDLSPLVII